MELILELFFDRLFILANELERIKGMGRHFFLRGNEFLEFDLNAGDPIPRWSPSELENEMQVVRGIITLEDKAESEGGSDEAPKAPDAEGKEEDSKKSKEKSGKPAGQTEKQEKSAKCSEPRRNGRTAIYRRTAAKPKRYATLGNVTFELSDSE